MLPWAFVRTDPMRRVAAPRAPRHPMVSHRLVGAPPLHRLPDADSFSFTSKSASGDVPSR
jgi:hypothetical protein